MKLHRFNEEGITRFGRFLDDLSADPAMAVPADLLTDPACAVAVPPGPEVEALTFANRMEAARYLDSLLTGITGSDVQRDAGLWAWLTLFYFDQLCPPDGHGRRNPGRRAKWIPVLAETRRYYRHMLLGPYLVFRAHRDNPDRAIALLASSVTVSTSEVYRLIVENPAIVSCRAAVEATTFLYYDLSKNRIRRGAGSKGAGGCRRLLQILQQFDCTYDLAMMRTQKLLELLPHEFDKYRTRRLFNAESTNS